MKLVKDLRQGYRWLKKIFFLREKSGVKVSIPLHKKIKYNLMGFTDFQYVIFDLKHNDHRDYISMWERYKLEYLDGDFAVLLSQKLLFARTFDKYINVPTVFCWVFGGRIIDPEDGQKQLDICEIARREEKLIAKPNHSVGGGEGIFEIAFSDGHYLVNDKEKTEVELQELVESCEDYLIVKYIESHDYSKSVYPYTANTIRVVTVMNDDHSEVEILFAFHRFGTAKSQPVDNMSKGGLFAYIDAETGICGKAKQLYNVKEDYICHPDTGTRIEGLQVPQWQELMGYLKQVHLKFPFYEFFAWDVMLNQDGIPYIMEINRGSDLSIQAIHPMRKDRLGVYMKERKMLDKR